MVAKLSLGAAAAPRLKALPTVRGRALTTCKEPEKRPGWRWAEQISRAHPRGAG